LLVSISIVLLLAALLASSLTKGSKAVKKISCVNNLRQISTVLSIYCDETEEQFPPRVAKSNWVYHVKAYTMNSPILRCPNERAEVSRSYLMNGFNDWFKQNLDSFEYFEFENWLWSHGLKRSAILQPSETILLGEKRSTSSHVHMDLLQNGGNDLEEVEHARHNSGANFAFADGSVSWKKQWGSVTPVNLWAIDGLWRNANTLP
jgi:prepilin-type processing-associated H-X9-DG protein